MSPLEEGWGRESRGVEVCWGGPAVVRPLPLLPVPGRPAWGGHLPCDPLTPSLTRFWVAYPFSISQPVLTPDVASTAQSCGHTSARLGGGGVCAAHGSPPTWPPLHLAVGTGKLPEAVATRPSQSESRAGRQGTGLSLYRDSGPSTVLEPPSPRVSYPLHGRQVPDDSTWEAGLRGTQRPKAEKAAGPQWGGGCTGLREGNQASHRIRGRDILGSAIGHPGFCQQSDVCVGRQLLGVGGRCGAGRGCLGVKWTRVPSVAGCLVLGLGAPPGMPKPGCASACPELTWLPLGSCSAHCLCRQPHVWGQGQLMGGHTRCPSLHRASPSQAGLVS